MNPHPMLCWCIPLLFIRLSRSQGFGIAFLFRKSLPVPSDFFLLAKYLAKDVLFPLSPDSALHADPVPITASSIRVLTTIVLKRLLLFERPVCPDFFIFPAPFKTFFR